MLMQSLVLGVFGSVVAAFVLCTVEPAPAPEATETLVELDGLELAAANWTHAGCIQLGTQCYDVFSDPNGDLWVCKACFTTNNPNPGKCRRLTPYELLNARWCAGGAPTRWCA